MPSQAKNVEVVWVQDYQWNCLLPLRSTAVSSFTMSDTSPLRWPCALPPWSLKGSMGPAMVPAPVAAPRRIGSARRLTWHGVFFAQHLTSSYSIYTSRYIKVGWILNLTQRFTCRKVPRISDAAFHACTTFNDRREHEFVHSTKPRALHSDVLQKWQLWFALYEKPKSEVVWHSGFPAHLWPFQQFKKCCMKLPRHTRSSWRALLKCSCVECDGMQAWGLTV